MKYLLALFAMLVLSGCDEFDPIRQTIVIDKEKREQVFISCMDKMKMTHEASFAGMDSAIEACAKIAVDYSITAIAPVRLSQIKLPSIKGNSEEYKLATPEQMQEILSNPNRPQPLKL